MTRFFVSCRDKKTCHSCHSPYSPSYGVPGSSNPAEIYRELSRVQKRWDAHNAKIIEQKASIVALATKWEAAGEITRIQLDDIVYMAQTSQDTTLWRPLLYVISRTAVAKRMQYVPASQRAGSGDEYIISDLKRSEFDLIEFTP